MRTIDLGNNESAAIGMKRTHDGRWLALTLSESKWFATMGGAQRWLARRGYSPDGAKLPPATPDPDAWVDRLDL